MVDQRSIKKYLQEHQETYFSVLELANIHGEDIRRMFSKINALKSDVDIASKQIDVGGKVGVVTVYAYQEGNSKLGNSLAEYYVARGRPETRNLHTETVESILIVSKLNEIIELLKGVSEKWK